MNLVRVDDFLHVYPIGGLGLRWVLNRRLWGARVEGRGKSNEGLEFSLGKYKRDLGEGPLLRELARSLLLLIHEHLRGKRRG